MRAMVGDHDDDASEIWTFVADKPIGEYEYLKRLNERYENWIGNYHEGRLLVINVDQFVAMLRNIGQNALQQVKAFDAAIGVTGLVVTKLDGTAKGGVVAAIARQSPKPLRFIGVGEQIDDLQTFRAKEFVEALFTPLGSGKNEAG